MRTMSKVIPSYCKGCPKGKPNSSCNTKRCESISKMNEKDMILAFVDTSYSRDD